MRSRVLTASHEASMVNARHKLCAKAKGDELSETAQQRMPRSSGERCCILVQTSQPLSSQPSVGDTPSEEADSEMSPLHTLPITNRAMYYHRPDAPQCVLYKSSPLLIQFYCCTTSAPHSNADRRTPFTLRVPSGEIIDEELVAVPEAPADCVAFGEAMLPPASDVELPVPVSAGTRSTTIATIFEALVLQLAGAKDIAQWSRSNCERSVAGSSSLV